MLRFITSPYIVVLLIIIAVIALVSKNNSPSRQWEFQSVDTMKYSRDLAREKLSDESFDAVIEQQMSAIAKTGATHVAIATPYDEEFLPILQRWVRAARRHDLNIWFRGNFSGWEQWFGYSKIDRQTHIAKTKEFIQKNQILFQDGDIFTSCPECENGEKINLYNPEALETYRNFLITEYNVTKDTFRDIGKKVKSNYYSMNGTIALALMDKETTKAFDGVVVVDHYVASPQKLAQDLKELAERSGGMVILGEFGAPIPDIHGAMTEEEQTAWLQMSLEALSQIEELKGINYWVNAGGSTALWYPDGKSKPAASILSRFYQSKVLQGKVIDESGEPVRNALIRTQKYEIHTDSHGAFQLPYVPAESTITISSRTHLTKTYVVSDPYAFLPIVLEKHHTGLFHLKSY